MDDDWLSAAEARDMVASLSPYRATNLICSRACDELVEARARRLIIGKKAIDNAKVPAGFWWARGQRALDQNWGTGDFSTWIYGKHELRAYGVEFRRSDIEAMLPRPVQPPFKAAPAGSYASSARCVTELAEGLGCSEHEAERLILKHCQMGAIAGRAAKTVLTRPTAMEPKQRNMSGQKFRCYFGKSAPFLPSRFWIGAREG